MAYPPSQVMYSPVMQSPPMQPPVMQPPMMQPSMMPPMVQPPMMQPSVMQPTIAYGQQQPLLYGMQTPPNIPGYEGIGGGFLPPPPIQPMPTPESQPAQDWNIPALSKEAAQKVFHEYVESKCCYSSTPARDGVITNVEAFNTYRYRMETFTESRQTKWDTKPYDGEPSKSQTLVVPNPWEIPVKVPAMFTNHTQEVAVPNTSSVKQCETCTASGKCVCPQCNGAKYITCTLCKGSEHRPEQQTCIKCSGRGKSSCSKCLSSGEVECDTCKGKKKLTMYIKLTVEWKNNTDDFVVEQSSGLDKSKLSEVNGKTVFKDTNLMVYPLSRFPERNLAEASERIVNEHYKKFSQTGRIMQQQQRIELIPINKVTYQWQGKDYVYFVYGNEQKVKAIDYPETCCCTII
ncbi:protein SSUH2 homolog [Clarias gariepinus]|uniref:protein SSUH2 homolog n=1 Tax=Clarias gariepinus TaxID=13013 RepID=UPI00234CAF1F|nr:protein SSUH2 homolog [Clarias gariepinus]